MQPILSVITAPEVIASLIAFHVFLFVLVIVLFVRISRMRRMLKRMFTGVSGENLEAGLVRLLAEMEEWKRKQSDQQFQLNRLSQKVSAQCANLAVMRYNAFGDTGSDLSFSLALLDDAQNGVVITSIYGRDESRTYAKPIEAGKSVYNLSEEELSVIKKATGKTG
jgi:hypothetical protein